MIATVVRGCGAYLPENAVHNNDLEKRLDTSHEWIVERTGIENRYVAAEGQTTSMLAAQACIAALTQAGWSADSVDMLVVATTTPDRTFPATAVMVQQAIGMKHGFAFDVQAVCSGFVYALAVVDQFIKTGQVKRALVVGAETFSRLLNWQDRTTAVLFGDGAGALAVEAVADANNNAKEQGILATMLHSDPVGLDFLRTDGGVSLDGRVGVVEMNGREVFRHAVARMGEVSANILHHHGLTAADIDWLIPHQANRRIIEAVAKKLELPVEKIVLTVQKHGNTSAASIPLALAAAQQDGRLQAGQLLLLTAMGAGFTWGGALLRW
ncbi:MAG: beta-ketoacyl-ACP synthase III [Alphaproteobacteria bacterium]